MKKKILVICGSQPRHMSILHKLICSFNISGLILCEREIVPQLARRKVTTNLSNQIFTNHLNKLKKDEFEFLGRRDWTTEAMDLIKKQKVPTQKVFDRPSLNAEKVINFTRNLDFDIIVDYGSWIIDSPLIQAMTHHDRKIYNIHGGISPFFKGSSTLLWALVLSQPELMGFTIHSMNKNIDDGDIYSYIFPDLSNCISPTELMAACQKSLYDQIIEKFQLIFANKVIPMKQPTLGSKLFLEKDFRVENLKSIYSIYSQPFSSEEIDTLLKRREQYLGKLSKFI